MKQHWDHLVASATDKVDVITFARELDRVARLIDFEHGDRWRRIAIVDRELSEEEQFAVRWMSREGYLDVFRAGVYWLREPVQATA